MIFGDDNTKSNAREWLRQLAATAQGGETKPPSLADNRRRAAALVMAMQ